MPHKRHHTNDTIPKTPYKRHNMRETAPTTPLGLLKVSQGSPGVAGSSRWSRDSPGASWGLCNQHHTNYTIWALPSFPEVLHGSPAIPLASLATILTTPNEALHFQDTAPAALSKFLGVPLGRQRSTRVPW